MLIIIMIYAATCICDWFVTFCRIMYSVTKGNAVFIVLFFLVCTGPGSSDFSRTNPQSGDFVACLSGENASMFCEVFTAGMVPQVIIWKMQLPGHSSFMQINYDTEGFELGGKIIYDPEYNFEINLKTNFTVIGASSMLDGAVIVCGYIDATTFSELARFIFRIYEPPCLHDIGLIKAVEDTTQTMDLSCSCAYTCKPFPTPDESLLQRNGITFTDAAYNSSHVRLDPIKRSHSGNYTLTTSNHRLDDAEVKIGSSIGKFSLNVLYGPDIQEFSNIISARIDTVVVLLCGSELIGNPVPTVVWRDNHDILVQNNEKFTMNDSQSEISLSIKQVDVGDTGQWKCYLSNEIAQRIVEINLFVFDPPSMPLDLSSCECNVTDSTEQIELSWKPPQKQGVPSHMYYDIDIYLYELGMQYLRTQRVISNVTGVVVHELEPARTYTFKLFAVSVYLSESGEGILAEMRGKPSETLTMSTVPGDILLSCDGLEAESGYVAVTWSVISDGGLSLTGLTVQYTVYGSTHNFVDTYNSAKDPLVTRFEAHGSFITGESYTFRIFAKNAHVSSDPVQCGVVAILEGIPVVPDPPVVYVNASERIAEMQLRTSATGTIHKPHSFAFEVKANSIDHEHNGSLIVYLYLRPNYSDGEVETVMQPLMSELPGGIYLFSARAINDFGSSGYSGNSNPVNVPDNPGNETVNGSCSRLSYHLILLLAVTFLSL